MSPETKSVLLVVFLGLMAGILIGIGFIAVTSVFYSLTYGAC